MSGYRLPAEWETQDAVLLTWPHQATDWATFLAEVEAVFFQLVTALCPVVQLVILCHNQRLRQRLQQEFAKRQLPQSRLHLLVVANNDSWARDHGPITVYNRLQQPEILNFIFTGWGDKFVADLDNAINRQLYQSGLFKAAALHDIALVLEGGSIECDGQGSLLLTEQCLLAQNRNPNFDKTQLEHQLARYLGAQRFFWLSQGHLAGDDTDAHIDTLARFTPDGGIVYVSCDDPTDEHYHSLQAMAAQLACFRRPTGEPYQLFALPWPAAKFGHHHERLPASYANFFICNQLVLVPQYRDAQDQAAIAVIAQAFPNHRVQGIDCLPLIHQYGSLHCVTMQLPRGLLCV